MNLNLNIGHFIFKEKLKPRDLNMVIRRKKTHHNYWGKSSGAAQQVSLEKRYSMYDIHNRKP
jgi:hypothetical protein